MNGLEFLNNWAIPNFSQNNHSFRDLRSSVFGTNGWRFELRFQPVWRDSPFQNVVSLITLGKPADFDGCIYWTLSVRDENNTHKFLCVNQKQLVGKLIELTPCWTVFPQEMLSQGEILTMYLGNLIFDCKVKVEQRSYDASHIHGHSPFRANAENPTMGSDKQLEFLNTGELSDFTIVTSCGREFKVHMVILANQSDYFQTLFNHKDTKEMQQKKVVFNDIPGTIMEPILHWIYAHTSGEGYLTDDVVTDELIETVNRLLIPSMNSFISTFLSTNLTIENVIPRAALAWLYFKDTAYKSIVNYFIDHAVDILGTESYSQMRDEEPHLIIAMHEEMVRRDGLMHHEQRLNYPFGLGPMFENNFYVPPNGQLYRPYPERQVLDQDGFLHVEGRHPNNYPGLHALNHAAPPAQHGVRHRYGNQPNQMHVNQVPPLAHLARNHLPLVPGHGHIDDPFPFHNNFQAPMNNMNANIVFNAPLDNIPNDIIFNGVVFRAQLPDANLWRDDGVDNINHHMMNFGFD